MYLIRFEKGSCKEYIIYQMDNDQLAFILSCDNGFQQCYINDDSNKIRLYFKVDITNTSIHQATHELSNYLNKRFDTNDDDWTICINERTLAKNHIITLYYFSNKYATSLKRLKRIVGNLHCIPYHFDISIYYNTNSKYKNLITVMLPNQSDYNKKFSKVYKMFEGHSKNILVDMFENLKDYVE